MDWGDLAEMALDQMDRANTVTRAIDDTAIPGETPMLATSARARQEWSNGTLVLTTHRLVYAKEGRPPVAVSLAGITDITATRSRLTGNVLRVVAFSGAYGWENVVRAETFVETLREAVATAITAAANAAQNAGEVSPQRPDGSAILDELARLAVLHRHGALTDDEFIQAKRQLIRG
ncbi:hypothetical protein [Embleya sp. NPDC020886]|uniref:hypothetical protein n=1 Tax=Embleya sp. NPDC020886 TaxID=3363980 RepID=UPI0037A477FE